MTQETLKNLLPKFIKDLENKSRSPSTILAYRADLEQLISFVESKQKIYAEQIGQEIIEAFRDSLLAQKYTPKTVSRKLNAVKTFFRSLLSEVANLKLNNIKSDNVMVEAYATQPERNIPLNKDAKQAVDEYLTERPKT